MLYCDIDCLGPFCFSRFLIPIHVRERVDWGRNSLCINVGLENSVFILLIFLFRFFSEPLFYPLLFTINIWSVIFWCVWWLIILHFTISRLLKLYFRWNFWFFVLTVGNATILQYCSWDRAMLPDLIWIFIGFWLNWI